ncbi:hypothetical protein Ctob_010291 [Chrysochromulina tobinii]|uniref:Uncharacterized protein n=1 Tax=Chrysochromulina tobinii TaxID=1460289 RepID=A0A0M0K1Y5_9EUKA|nr:hypothetical protein Ctob_010291 [Chrysochromulina tobinii]|eukprot:KOO32592.1 hypothetical protein Ctob_010291 [Chrysochromulina sp. CCMP291]
MGCASSKAAISDSMGKAVWEAARDGKEAELTRLIGLGGNVNWRDEDGRTGLLWASRYGHEGCVRLLLAAEAIEVNAKDIYDYTALHNAAIHGRLAIAKRLLEGGADPTLRTKFGKTAIDSARENGESEIVALLSEPRASPMGPHGESRSHILKILGRSPHGPLPRAVVGTSGVGGGLAAWFATPPTACSRPTPSPHAVVLGEGAAAATASDCLATFTTTLRKPSRFLSARDDAPWEKAAAEKAAAERPAFFHNLFNKCGLCIHAPAAKAAWNSHKPTFYFLPRAAVLGATATQLKRMQELRDSKLLEKMAVDLNEAFQGTGLIQNILFVSHRWEDWATPDETGAQLAALQAHLRADPEVQYVWFDYACMPQRSSGCPPDKDDRTPAEKAEFDLMLSAIADLYLTAKVLILLDTMYRTRFWTTMEGWCSMQQVTSEGVRPAREGESRVTVVCIHNATQEDKQALLNMSTKTPAEMSKFLASPDVAVTNKKDKVTMLPIVGKTDEHVREMMSGMHV